LFQIKEKLKFFFNYFFFLHGKTAALENSFNHLYFPLYQLKEALQKKEKKFETQFFLGFF
jgi:hypothetical protein